MSVHWLKTDVANPQSEAIIEVTARLLEAIHKGDSATYRAMCLADLTCFENDVSPLRIDGVDFHSGMIETATSSFKDLVRCDLVQPMVRVFTDSAVICYTRLMTYRSPTGPRNTSANETRVYVQVGDIWKLAHLHRTVL